MARKTPFTHADSVFIFKHLGVMYSAMPQKRKKGKLFFHQLLEVEPEAHIVDMIVSDEMQEMFKSVQDEIAFPDRRQDSAGGRCIGWPPLGDGNEGKKDPE